MTGRKYGNKWFKRVNVQMAALVILDISPVVRKRSPESREAL